MESRIKDALSAARMPTREVSKHVAETFGEPPPQCIGGSDPGPGPGPSPSVPVPPTNVQAVLQGASVLVHWTDTVNTAATGYTVERKVGTGGYAELSAAPGPEARTYLDRTPVAGAQNCYVVYTRGAAGPSGFSAEACVAVPGTVTPPDAGHVPLACEGAIGAQGSISMVCNPQTRRR